MAGMKKSILKRIADALEKLAIGSALIGIFKGVDLGVQVAIVFAVGLFLTGAIVYKFMPNGK